MSESRLLWSLCVSVCAAVACGGGGGSTPEAETPAHGDPSGEPEAAGDADSTEPPPPADPCASGTCSKCGDAVCLTGFYCEEAVSACGWLPQCADSPTCECVSKVLGNCSCEERDGGVYVQCG